MRRAVREERLKAFEFHRTKLQAELRLLVPDGAAGDRRYAEGGIFDAQPCNIVRAKREPLTEKLEHAGRHAKMVTDDILDSILRVGLLSDQSDVWKQALIVQMHPSAKPA